MSARAAVGVAWLALAGGCRVGGVEERPLAGPPPEVVAVWPLVAAPADTAQRDWFPGLAAGLRRRGYRVVPDGVAVEILRDAGLPPTTTDANAIGRALQADALLQLRVRAFSATGERALQEARWDLEWRLVSTRGAGIVWSFEHHGNWRQADRAPLDPFASLDEQDEPPAIVPIGGNRLPGFRDADELLAWLHRLALDHLPARGRT